MSRMTLLASVAVLLASPLAVGPARADVYTWVDAKGVLTVSNLEPPEGSRVTSVTHDTPQAIAARNEAVREARRQAEVQALADRVRQLEAEVEIARQPPPPPAPAVTYVPVPTPMIIPVQSEPATLAPAASAPACDPSWYGCWAWNSWLYPAGVVVLPGTVRHRRDDRDRHGPGAGGPRPPGSPNHRPHAVAARSVVGPLAPARRG